MILFIGSEEKAFFASEVVNELDESIVCTKNYYHISEIIQSCTENTYSHIIVDCEQFIDDFRVISRELQSIKSVTTANIIILAVGFSVESELIQALAVRGFRNYIIDPILSNRKEQLKNCLLNVNSILDDMTNFSGSSVVLQEEEISSNAQKKKTIAFAGASTRIGTTTQALQYCKYLKFMGKSVCYIEFNKKGFVEIISQVFSEEYEDKEIGKLVYRDIEMFDKPESLESILKLPYDYFVYDFGSFTDNNFNLFSFIEKDIKVCVCGCKANELTATTKLIERTYSNDVFYLFNFTDETEHKDVLTMMSKKEKKTLFASPCFDYFSYKSSSNTLYSQIDPIKKEEKVKKSFLNWRAKK